MSNACLGTLVDDDELAQLRERAALCGELAEALRGAHWPTHCIYGDTCEACAVLAKFDGLGGKE